MALSEQAEIFKASMPPAYAAQFTAEDGLGWRGRRRGRGWRGWRQREDQVLGRSSGAPVRPLPVPREHGTVWRQASREIRGSEKELGGQDVRPGRAGVPIRAPIPALERWAWKGTLGLLAREHPGERE